MSRRVRRFASLILGIAAVATLLACAASAKPQKMTDEELLRKRATEYWTDKVKGDLHLSYGYEIPSYREKVTVVDYIKGFGQTIKWTDAEVRGIDMDGDRARIEIFVRFRIQIPKSTLKTSEDYVRESWVKVQGEWYHIPFGFVYQ